jgi:hypothetical protein
MATKELTMHGLKLFPKECRNYSKNQIYHYLYDILVNDGIFAFVNAEDRIALERLHVNKSRQIILEKLAYLLIAIGAILIFKGLFLISGIIFIGSFVSMIYSKIWFKNRIDFMLNGYYMDKELSKDMKLLESFRQKLIEKKKQEGEKSKK